MTEKEALEALTQFEDDAEEAGRLHAEDRTTCHRCRILIDENHRHAPFFFLPARV